MSIGASLFLIVIGAILMSAVHVDSTVFDVRAAGIIILVVGIISLALTLLFWFTRRDRMLPPRDYTDYMRDEPPRERIIHEHVVHDEPPPTRIIHHVPPPVIHEVPRDRIIERERVIEREPRRRPADADAPTREQPPANDYPPADDYPPDYPPPDEQPTGEWVAPGSRSRRGWFRRGG